MKKSIGYLICIYLCCFLFCACSKQVVTHTYQNTIHWNAEQLASNPSFIQLNEILSRFDPVYLQIIYKENPADTLLARIEVESLQMLSQNINDTFVQNKIALQYHFDSKEQLMLHLNNLNIAVRALSVQYNLGENELTDSVLHILLVAKKQFAKNKLDAMRANENRKKTTGIGQAFASEYASEFDYYNTIYNENMEDELSGDILCSDPCCIALVNCNAKAHSVYWSNSYSLVLGSMVTFGTIGFYAGTMAPIIGNLTGMALSGTLGMILAVARARELYNQAQAACVINYKSCSN